MMRLYSSGRTDLLARRLADMLADSPLDPMENEWVGVSSQGMRRWLLLELARHLGASKPGTGDGAAANFELPFPGSLRVQVLEAGRADDDPDPWEIERLVWMVLSVSEASADDPSLDAFNRLPEGASRYGKARRVADLFDRYHVHRPHMIRQWAAGLDRNGLGRPLPEHHAWQSHLWRLVRTQIGEPSPPERLPELLNDLREGRLNIHLPRRVSLFGLTSLPCGSSLLELCEALAAERDVHLFLLEPTHFDVGAVAAFPSTEISGMRVRSEDDSGTLAAHPLLRSWGRPHREASLLLADARGTDESSLELVEDPSASEPARTVLARLQQDIGANRELSGSFHVDGGDRSLQLHACHGSTRQVEVLRDAILHLLATPELDLVEEDVLVICPALPRFAPLVEAVFGPSADSSAATSSGPSGSPLLRYRIADRSVSDANPVLNAMTVLMDLVGSRFDATSVLDFISLASVRHRFDFDDDDLATIGDWVERSDVRWGLTPEHRAGFGVPATIVTNTWRAALDRLLLGSAISDDAVGLSIGEVAVVGVEGGQVEALGRLAELLWRLTELTEVFSRQHTIGEWIDVLSDRAMELFSAPVELAWQMQALSAALIDVAASAGEGTAASEVLLNGIDVRRLFGDRLLNSPGRPDFFRGGITVTTLKPLRAIPYRVVCLLGADENAFVTGNADGDDLAALGPVVGDPDARADDRQALLEAVLAARDSLVVVREGHDVRTNQEVRRAVVLEELRDAAVATVHPDDRAHFARQLEVNHPRQAFDDRCFIAGELMDHAPWSFDRGDLEGAEARRDRAGTSPPFITSPLISRPEDVVDLSDLQAFVKHPVTWFVTRRLDARLPRSAEARETGLPVAPGGLEKWKLGDGLLAARRSGLTSEAWARIERQRGTIPPGSIGEALIGELVAAVDRLVDASQNLGITGRAGTDLPVDVDVVLPDGTRIVGSVHTQLTPPRPGPARITYSKRKLDHRLAAWLDLIALVASDPITNWRSVVVSRTGLQKHPVAVVELNPHHRGNEGQAAAMAALEFVVDCFRKGSDEPIPLFPSFLENVHLGKQKASDWAGDFGSSESTNVATALVYGDYDFDSLMSLPARPGDPGDSGGRVERFAHAFFRAMESSAATVEDLT
jgi:exodeoxyribonuclease V gamma subunit